MLTKYITKWDAGYILTTLSILWQYAVSITGKSKTTKLGPEKKVTFYTNMTSTEKKLKSIAEDLIDDVYDAMNTNYEVAKFRALERLKLGADGISLIWYFVEVEESE